MLYTNKNNDKIKNIKKLNQKKYRDKENLFLVEGEHLVLEAYKCGMIKELILEQDTVMPLNVDTMYVTNDIRILVVDEIQDPGNLGTIIRSAVAFNIDTIILSNDTVDLYNPKVVRATQGLMFHINIIRRNLLEILPKLKNEKYKLLSTNVNHGKSLKTLEKNSKFAIIMGNEGNGVKEEISDLCDEFLYIDMNESCESLNVGVATSIILYELDK